jgi:hypothetical protein
LEAPLPKHFTSSAMQQQEAYWASLLAEEGLDLLEASPEGQAALQEAAWLCEVCAQSNTLLIETIEGDTQHHMQDCAVCCNPHQLHCTWQQEAQHWQVEASAMNGL